MSFSKVLHNYLTAIFALDHRSLGLFRIGLGLVICYDLWTLWPHIDAFFGAHGVYPIALFDQNHALSNWSIHALSDAPYLCYGLFIVHFSLGIALILGYQTRFTTLLCWIMTVSLVHRNPMAMFLGRDYALILFLMWGIFLPLGNAFSLDNIIKKRSVPDSKTLSIAGIGLICSLLMIYLLCGWLKIHPSWNQDLTAISLVLHNPDLVTPAGIWLSQFPDLLKGLTWLIVVMERFGILLVLIPVKSTVLRSALIIWFCAFHLGLMTTMIVDWFALIMMTAWVALIPSDWWGKKNSDLTVVINKNPWSNGAALCLLIFISVCNYKNADEFFNQTSKSNVFSMARYAGLDFPWRLFSPSPPLTYDVYYFIPIFEKQDARDVPPLQDYQIINKNYRWKFLLDNQTLQTMPYLNNYLIRFWNQQYPARPRVIDVTITRTTRDIDP